MDEYIVADLNALLSTGCPDDLVSEALEKFLNALAVKGYELAHVVRK